jgi:hypothetical protein
VVFDRGQLRVERYEDFKYGAIFPPPWFDVEQPEVVYIRAD